MKFAWSIWRDPVDTRTSLSSGEGKRKGKNTLTLHCIACHSANTFLSSSVVSLAGRICSYCLAKEGQKNNYFLMRCRLRHVKKNLMIVESSNVRSEVCGMRCAENWEFKSFFHLKESSRKATEDCFSCVATVWLVCWHSTFPNMCSYMCECEWVWVC